MKTYVATIRGERYSTEYRVQAHDWSTAAARAVKAWKQRFKGSRTKEMTIKLVIVGEEAKS